MVIGGWTLVAWIGAAIVMLAFLKVSLSRVCSLSCEELSCIRDRACERRDV